MLKKARPPDKLDIKILFCEKVLHKIEDQCLQYVVRRIVFDNEKEIDWEKVYNTIQNYLK